MLSIAWLRGARPGGRSPRPAAHYLRQNVVMPPDNEISSVTTARPLATQPVIDRLNALEAALSAQIEGIGADLEKLLAGFASGIDSEFAALGIENAQGIERTPLATVFELLPWAVSSAVASATLTWALATMSRC